MDPGVQPPEELEELYAVEDPWSYENDPQDARRVARVLAAVPERHYERTLDIGCGNGFLTVRLPGAEVVGADVSARAVGWAEERARREGHRATFVARGLFDLRSAEIGTFELVVVTGVLYPQYVGRGSALVTQVLTDLLRPGGVLVTAHIDGWCTYRAPFTLLSTSIDPYRSYVHRLEVLQR